MPYRPFSREQAWLLPPSLDEMVPQDHPSRFVAVFLDSLKAKDWTGLGVSLEGEVEGAPGYHPRALLAVWLYGFMTGTRSSRKLEAACRDQVPFLWLTGWQRPDHNTLWRFYKDHREAMRQLFKRTIRTAHRAGLVELALQAVDGTKIQANASIEHLRSERQLQDLLAKAGERIQDLERENESGDDPPAPRLPEGLRGTAELKKRITQALAHAHEERQDFSPTDPDARMMKGRRGMTLGYNAQAMVSSVRDGETTSLIATAGAIGTNAGDSSQLIPMLEQAEEQLGTRAEVTLADAGYHAGANLAAAAEREQVVLMPEHQAKALEQPYHKDQFVYDAAADTYACPQGHVLTFFREKMTRHTRLRQYRGSPAICRACPAFGVCTRSSHHGRTLSIGPHERLLREHRTLMKTEDAKALYRIRKTLPEPVFGIIKEQMGFRRFFLRGIRNVAAEWIVVLTAFNLRSLWKLWRGGAYLSSGGRSRLVTPARA